MLAVCVPNACCYETVMKWWRAALVVLLVLAFFAALIWIPWTVVFALAGLAALVGIVLLRKPAWRNGALVLSTVMFGLSAAELVFVMLEPSIGEGGHASKTHTPWDWTIYERVLGYRARPDTKVEALAQLGDKVIFRKTYTIEPSGFRATPTSGTGEPTWLFIGDSLVFGEGLNDDETIVSRFASRLGGKGRVLNLGMLGYGPNHLVRALETGAWDDRVQGKVAAVFTWIMPHQLGRVTGDHVWLPLSPAYTLDREGRPVHRGDFITYWLTHPVAGLGHLVRTRSAWMARAFRPTILEQQTELYVALLKRLQELVKERYGVPLVLIYDWPEGLRREPDDEFLPLLKPILALGMPMVSIRKIVSPAVPWNTYFIENDGHPTAYLADLAAAKLWEAVGKP